MKQPNQEEDITRNEDSKDRVKVHTIAFGLKYGTDFRRQNKMKSTSKL